MSKPALLCICLLLTFFSCKIPRLSTSVPKADTDEFSIQEVDFDYFNSKSKVAYKDAGNNLTATANIRIKKDSLIWFSVAKAGIEGLRGMITTDSVYLLNKLKNEYTVYDFQSLSQQFNFDINFKLVQAAMLGNLPVTREAQKGRVNKEDDHFLLRQNRQSVEILNYIGKNNRKLTKVVMTDQATGNSLVLDYSDFNRLHNFLFPYESTIALDYQSATGEKSSTSVAIEHQKAEISDIELKFPFNVPDKYERK